jgi:phage portal protein BeeE
MSHQTATHTRGKNMNFPFFKKRSASWANLDAFEGRESSAGIHINETVALGIPAVFACVRVLTEAIASLPLLTYERFDNGDKDRARSFFPFPPAP